MEAIQRLIREFKVDVGSTAFVSDTFLAGKFKLLFQSFPGRNVNVPL